MTSTSEAVKLEGVEDKPVKVPVVSTPDNVPGQARIDYIREVVFVKAVRFFDKFKAGFIYRLKAYPLAIWDMAKICFMNGWEVIKAYKYAVWNGSCRPLCFKANGKIVKGVFIGRLLFLGSFVLVNIPVVLVRYPILGKWFIVGMVAESGLWLVNHFLVVVPDYVIAGLIVPLVPVLIAGFIAGYNWREYQGLKYIIIRHLENKRQNKKEMI